MEKTLRKYLEKELRATSEDRQDAKISGMSSPYLEEIGQCIQEDFRLSYGLIAPVEETIDRVINKHYSSKGYLYKGSFYEEGIFIGILGSRVKNYCFEKEDSRVIIRIAEIPPREKLNVNVLSTPGFLSPQSLEREAEERQN